MWYMQQLDQYSLLGNGQWIMTITDYWEMESALTLIYVKKTYQFKIHCKDDVMISLH